MDSLYLVCKILLSLVFIASSIAVIYLCSKASEIESKAFRLEKLIKEDIRQFYETGTVASKIVMELLLRRI